MLLYWHVHWCYWLSSSCYPTRLYTYTRYLSRLLNACKSWVFCSLKINHCIYADLFKWNILYKWSDSDRWWNMHSTLANSFDISVPLTALLVEFQNYLESSLAEGEREGKCRLLFVGFAFATAKPFKPCDDSTALKIFLVLYNTHTILTDWSHLRIWVRAFPVYRGSTKGYKITSCASARGMWVDIWVG